MKLSLVSPFTPLEVLKLLTEIAMVATLEKSNLGSLRSLQHKDQYGNVISMSLSI